MNANDQHCPPIDRAGIFRGHPIRQTVKRFESGSVAIVVRYYINQELESGTWVDVNFEAFGNHFIIKRDGTPNQAMVSVLSERLGWDGDLSTVSSSDWVNRAVQLDIRREQYEGIARFKVAWINDFDQSPAASGTADEATIEDLVVTYGPQLRALCSTASENAPVATAPTVTRMGNRDSAWSACLRANKGEPSKANDAWQKKIGAIDKDESTFTSVDWRTIEDSFIPF